MGQEEVMVVLRRHPNTFYDVEGIQRLLKEEVGIELSKAPVARSMRVLGREDYIELRQGTSIDKSRQRCLFIKLIQEGDT